MSLTRDERILIFCSCFTGIVSFSILFSGNLLVEDVRNLFKASYSQVSIIPSVWCGSMSLGFIPALLFRRFTIRTTLFACGLITSLGFTGAAFSSSFTVMMLFLVGINGPVLGAATVGTIYAMKHVMRSEVFHKALAIYTTSGAVGLFVLPYLYQLLWTAYSLRGTLVIFGAMTLNICVTASAMPNEYTVEEVLTEKGPTPPIIGLIKNPLFHLMNVLILVDSISFTALTSFMMSLLIEGLQYSPGHASGMISVAGGLGVLGRLSVYFMPRNMCISRITIYIIILLIQVFSVLLIGILPSVPVTAGYFLCLVFWISSAAAFTLHPVVVVDVFDDYFDVAYSVGLFAQAAMMLTVPAFVGLIVDLTGSFLIPLRLAGSIKIVTCTLPLLWISQDSIRRKMKSNDTNRTLLMQAT